MSKLANKTNKIIGIIGGRGRGKTLKLTKLIIMDNRPTIVIDPRLQIPKGANRRLFFKSSKLFLSWIIIKKNYDDFVNLKLELIIQTSVYDDYVDITKYVNSRKKILFVIDEVDLFFNNSAKKDNPLIHFVNFGRHDENNLIWTARRPTDISKILTASIDIWYFAQIIENSDLDYFRKRFNKEVSEKLKNMERFYFLKLDLDNDSTIVSKDNIKLLEYIN
jgi:hypothetical protein